MWSHVTQRGFGIECLHREIVIFSSVIGCVGITQLSLDSKFPSVKAQHLDPYIGILLAKDKRKGSSMHKGHHSKLIFMVPKTTVFPEMSVCN